MHIKWGSAEWKNAAITALASCICYWITLALGLNAGYWAAITSIVVMQSQVAATLLASRDRLIGTAIGALIGWAAELFWHDHLVLYGLAICAAIAICNVLDLQSAGRLAGVSVTIVVLIHGSEPAWQTALNRFIQVSLGILVALAMTAIFYPGSFVASLAVRE